MHNKTVRKLMSLKNELNSLLEEKPHVIDSTRSVLLQNDIEKNIFDVISETIDEVDVVIESIENGDYDEPSDFSFDDY